MSISNRIKKLESSVSPDSEFCDCPRQRVSVVFRPDLNRTEEQRLNEIEENSKPRFCETCKKEIHCDHKVITVEFV